ncbi:MAG: hypothetical protein Fur0011_3530 [Candidatus Microgenomates bacterium]
MKKILATFVLLMQVSAVSVSAETVRTCQVVYGGGEICGETTTTATVKHEVVETGAGDLELFYFVGSFAGFAVVATGLYKLTYKSYIFG